MASVETVENNSFILYLNEHLISTISKVMWMVSAYMKIHLKRENSREYHMSIGCSKIFITDTHNKRIDVYNENFEFSKTRNVDWFSEQNNILIKRKKSFDFPVCSIVCEKEKELYGSLSSFS